MRSIIAKYLLHQLAQLYGVQIAYYDSLHSRQVASTESLLSILQALGAPIITPQDIAEAWRERRQAWWQHPLEPVLLAWDNKPNLVTLRLPISIAETILGYSLKLETGDELQGEWYGKNQTTSKINEVEGVKYVTKHLALPSQIPWGYHQLDLEVAGQQKSSLLISAPTKAYIPQDLDEHRRWGIFLPLYSLHSQNSWGGGNFTDLEDLMSWIGQMGGNVIATLPLLATFMDHIWEISPYLPISRLLWNEFYLDINKIPELGECSSAQALLGQMSFQDEIQKLRKSPLVNYRQQMLLKRKLLGELSHHIYLGESKRLSELIQFARANPHIEDYARFRATCDQQRSPWRLWPQPLREGVLRQGSYSEENKRYHLYVQWLASQQMTAVTMKAEANKLHLYLDLPLGVHPDGYDVWRERDNFIMSASAGAPPDTVFTKGQNWTFPPLHPEKIRDQHYRHLITYLRHHCRYADVLRIDHIMGLHRLFCIPQGMQPNQGVYLRYHADELYAILTLESQRNRTILVGEDLGTVPRYVRPTMKKHGLQRMYVMHYELATNPQNKPPTITPNSVASLNTHDIPPFAAFWQGTDIRERSRLGILGQQKIRREVRIYEDMRRDLNTYLRENSWLDEEDSDITAVLRACLSFLAASPARMMLVNLEDLWLETESQNIPSTKTEYPNWQHKMRYTLEELCQMPEVLATLGTVDKLRKRVINNDKKA